MVPSRNFFGHEIVIAISDHFTFPSSNVVLIILTFTFHFNSKAHFFIIWVKGLFGIALTVHGSLTFFYMVQGLIKSRSTPILDEILLFPFVLSNIKA